MGVLEQMVITLREGVEAALIVAIAVAYLRRIGRPDLLKTVYTALVAAIGVSLAGAIALTIWHGNEDNYEGWLMLAAAVFVATMVWWMHRTAHRLRGEIESALAKHQAASRSALFLFVFFMVLREGVETVLMLSAVTLDSSDLLAWLGGVAGLALAVVFAVAFVRGSLKVHVGRFFRITTWILGVIAVQLLISGLHELAEAGVIPSSREEMALVGPIVRNDVFFFVVILGLAAVLILRERGALRAQAVAATAGGGDAARRKQMAESRRDRRWSTMAAMGAFVCMVLITADYVYALNARALSPATTLEATDGWVTIPMKVANDGALHRFQVDTPAGAVRFFTIRRPDGTVAVALDACQICGARGYYQHGNQLFCRNCDAPINIASLGTYGGCNPVPLAFTQHGSLLAIQVSRLTAEAPLFR